MHIYFAGADSNKFLTILRGVGATHVLTSFAGYYKKHDKFKGDYISFGGMKIFLDCGAYSAWTQGYEIDVHDYAQFLVKYADLIDVYPNLDVKGDPKKTVENQLILESYGLHPIPVYHMTMNDLKTLKGYAEKYEYIALGAIAGERNSVTSLIDNMAAAFDVLEHNPVTKIHAFGMTIRKVLQRFPVYSSDSTRWFTNVKYGGNITKTPQEKMWVTRRNHEKALSYSIRQTLSMEKEITELWEARGIKFNEYQHG